MYETGTLASAASAIGRLNVRGKDEARVIEGATSGIREANSRVNTLIERTRDLGDRLFGSVPQPGAQGSISNQPMVGEVSEMQQAIAYLHESLGELERQVNRLTPAL